ncbi:MAG: HAD family hydrolase [Coriobacteriales bacterium]|jgi:phosphoglycolate phosphatase
MATLVLDYDGTIHDTNRIYAPSVRLVYADLVGRGLAPMRNFTDEEIASFIGWKADELWGAMVPDLSKDLQVKSIEAVARNMGCLIESGEARLYPGAEEALDELKKAGHELIFLSNCLHSYMEMHRKVFELDRFFSGFYCTEDYNYLSKPEIFEYVKRDFGDPSTKTYIAIGDRLHDIELATSAGLLSIGCLYGFGRPGELDPATIKIDDVRKMPEAVEELLA